MTRSSELPPVTCVRGCCNITEKTPGEIGNFGLICLPVRTFLSSAVSIVQFWIPRMRSIRPSTERSYRNCSRRGSPRTLDATAPGPLLSRGTPLSHRGSTLWAVKSQTATGGDVIWAAFQGAPHSVQVIVADDALV